MARAIDEKIVRMQMDDSDFTSKVKSVLSRFGDLDKGFNKLNSANVTGPANGLGQIGNKAGELTTQLNAVQNSVEFLASKFTLVGQIGQAAIAKVTNSVMDMSAKVLKGATIQPVIDGYNEYANKLKSINVIMNNLPDGSKDLGAVKSTLAELNGYADQTIYSFEDMTTNMGTFTAAGVGLKDSAVAIEGIGNLAASSGSSTEQMSTAMYQLSQALASGKVGLQDWNSVVNAGMGGQKFQKALSATAKELGHGRNEAVSFRDSLQDGWLTSEVLLKTLQKFKEDKSMQQAATQVKTFADLVDTTAEGLGSAWAQVWENIIGDSEEAPALWTGIANAIQGPIGAMDNYNKSTSKAFHDMGGRQAIINAFSNIFQQLAKILGVVGNAFSKVFPPATAKQLVDLAKGFENFTNKLKISNTDLKNIQDTFQGFFTIIKWGINLIKMVAGALVSLIPRNLFSVIESVTGAIGRFIISMDKSASNSKRLQTVLDILSTVIKGIRSVFENAGAGVEFFANHIGKLIGFLKDLAGPVVNKVVGVGKKIADTFKTSASGITPGEMLGGVGVGGMLLLAKKIADTTKNISKSFDGLIDFFKKGGPLSGAISGAKDVLDGLGKALNTFTTSVKIFSLVEISLALLGMAGALKVLASIDGSDVFKSLEMLGVMLLAMNFSLNLLGSMKGSALRAIAGAAALVILATAIDMLVVAVAAFGYMDSDNLIQGMTALTGTIIVLVGAMELLSRISPRVIGASMALVPLALAIDMIAVAVAGLSFISVDGILKGVGSIAGVLLALGAFVKIVDGAKFGIGTSLSIVGLALAINMLVIPIIALGKIDFNTVATGLLEMGALFVSLGVFARILDGVKIINAALGITLMSGAILLISGALIALSFISFEDLAKGVFAIALSLAAMAAAMVLASGAMGGAIAITIMAGALNLLVVPLKVLGSMSVPELVTALVALAGSFLILGAAGYLIGPIAPALMMVALSITALGLAVALAGVGIAAFGIGISAFAAGLVTLAGLTAASVAAIGLALGGLVDVLIGLVPKFTELGIAILHSFVDGIVTQVPYLMESLAQLILSIFAAIDTYGPQIITKGSEMILHLAEGLVIAIPNIALAITMIIVALAQALGDNAPTLINAGIQLMMDLINGMANGIRDNQEAIVTSVLNLVESVIEIIITALQQVSQILFGWIPGFKGLSESAGNDAKEALRGAFGIDEVATQKAQGAVDGVNSRKGLMNGAGQTLAQAGQAGMATLDGAGTGSKKGFDFTSGLHSNTNGANGAGQALAQAGQSGAGSADMHGTGGNKGNEFAGGLGSAGNNASGAGEGLGNHAKSGVESVKLEQSGHWAGEGFASGIGGTMDSVIRAASGIANAAKGIIDKVLHIASPSRVMKRSGHWFGAGFALGIDGEVDNVTNSAQKMAIASIEAMTNAHDEINTLMDNMSWSPSITPVIDGSNLAYAQGFNLSPDNTSLKGNYKVDNVQNGQQASIITTKEINNNQQIHITQQPGESAEALAQRIEAAIENRTY